ncbi:MAG: NAD(P)H-dependent oxidoreductase [Chitinophagales bacterium]|nr:NAD(P)H-dependent oxidoreductase [Chitinophagales bacterium]
MKIFAFGASSNRNSINQKMALYAAKQFGDADIQTIDLNDFEMPLYSIDREQQIGIPKPAQIFMNYVQDADLIIISFAEHNGSYSSIFKNLFDWASRVNIKTFMGKPMLLMAASTGRRGAISVLEAAVNRFPIHDGRIAGTFSMSEFHKNFHVDEGIIGQEMKERFDQVIDEVKKQLNTIHSDAV